MPSNEQYHNVFENITSNFASKINCCRKISSLGNLNFAYVTMADNRPGVTLACYITNRISSISVGGSSVTLSVSDPGTGISTLQWEFSSFIAWSIPSFQCSLSKVLRLRNVFREKKMVENRTISSGNLKRHLVRPVQSRYGMHPRLLLITQSVQDCRIHSLHPDVISKQLNIYLCIYVTASSWDKHSCEILKSQMKARTLFFYIRQELDWFLRSVRYWIGMEFVHGTHKHENLFIIQLEYVIGYCKLSKISRNDNDLWTACCIKPQQPYLQ